MSPRYLLLIILFAGVAQAEAWHLAKDEDGIQVYLDEVPESKYQRFRGVTLIKASARTLGDLQENLRVACKWLYGCASMRLLEVEGDSTWVYLTTELPWPASPRDMVIRVQTERRDDGSLLRHLSAVAGKVERQPQLIRVSQLKGLWTMVPKGEQLTEVTYQLEAEPAGDIPSWPANQFVIDAPMVSLRTLRAVAERQGAAATQEAPDE
ncbi:START domain-containing protein [Pseudomonas auratipiscis]|uniref:START domain-containing protein n=1 Tax=Pseudomonas auratipiscis TaxID=3115853 RepID=A0AB35WX91_9PSED|nr:MULTISPECIES: START domain-containing protein [unclassified Pseudomonas]MEE1867756.1 START domain-containing protein [Pseudomonas sp. 120P]MEE1960380.1 START domain-containing protein [Pseudomonas sp. 119P]